MNAAVAVSSTFQRRRRLERAPETAIRCRAPQGCRDWWPYRCARSRCQFRATSTRDAAVGSLLRNALVLSADQYRFQEPEPAPQSECSSEAMSSELRKALVCAGLSPPEQCTPIAAYGFSMARLHPAGRGLSPVSTALSWNHRSRGWNETSLN